MILVGLREEDNSPAMSIRRAEVRAFLWLVNGSRKGGNFSHKDWGRRSGHLPATDALDTVGKCQHFGNETKIGFVSTI